ncbi:MAG TPA: class I SAM-dependent methyltransferase [Candidatus Cybelea sp.]|jgi:SAM-dependent methyltransferase|nr:class I SAM-dependent methyltransferase [Candidatus Cybelea sp.]
MKSTERFGSRAQAYAAFRPTYPPSAIDAALDGLGDPNALTIADVGAGTGISARLFADRGAAVIAIEPNAKMRGAADPHIRVRWREGTGEETGLPDASVDAIVACQAFHWFATPEALDEFRRVARRRAVVLQYERDERDVFTRAYGDIVRAHATDDAEELRRRALEFFAAFPNARTESEHLFRQRLDAGALLGRAASASYLPSTGRGAERLREDLRVLFERYEREGHVDLAMVTYAFVADW